jgi:hypothetical protein
MSAEVGPDIVTDGLVLALDGANIRSFKGEAMPNLYSVSAGQSANNSIWEMPMGGTATGTYQITSDYGSWNGNTTFKVTVSSGTLSAFTSFRRCVAASFDTTYGTTRRLSAKVKMIKGSITGLSRHSGGGTGTHNSSNFTTIDPRDVAVDITDKNGWYQFDVDVSGTYPFGHCVGIGIVSSDIQFLVTEMMLYPSSTFSLFTPTTRGTTVATGGGWADLSGNTNHGELVNGLTFNSGNRGSLVFDGVDDYVSVPFSNSLALSSVGSLSVWCYPLTLAQGSFAGLVGMTINGNSGGQSYSMHWRKFDDTIQAGIQNSGTYNNISKPIPTTIQWYNFVFTWNGSFLNLYENGISATSPVTQTINAQQLNTQVDIGGNMFRTSAGQSGHFTGYIPQVQIYNRALSAAEVQQNYNATRNRFGV